MRRISEILLFWRPLVLENVYISSRANPVVIKYAKLADKKYREQDELFLCEGAKLFSEAVGRRTGIEAVLLREGQTGTLVSETLYAMRGISVYKNTRFFTLSASAFDKISSEKAPEGVICVLNFLKNIRTVPAFEESRAKCCAGEKLMLLCSVRDPGNAGTIVRSAAAFGFDRLIFSADSADLYSSRAMRAAMGALFKIKVDLVGQMRQAVSALIASGRRVFAAEIRPGALSADTVGVGQSDCFLIGNEGHGIPPEISAACSGSVYIPIRPDSESLNAAAAASIFAFMQRS